MRNTMKQHRFTKFHSVVRWCGAQKQSQFDQLRIELYSMITLGASNGRGQLGSVTAASFSTVVLAKMLTTVATVSMDLEH